MLPAILQSAQQTTRIFTLIELLQNKEVRQTSPSPSRELGNRRSSYPLLNARIDNGQD